MKRLMGLWQFFGFAITTFSGTLLHFLYEWLDEFLWIAPFSGVNESTWEHMKLLFWPMLIFAVFQSFFYKSRDDFWCVKLKSILLSLGLIPLIFYSYNGIIGKSPDWVNIAIFFVAAAVGFVYESTQFYKSHTKCNHPKLAVVILCLIAVLFVIFSFLPPEINIFRDPVSEKFGIS